MQILKRNRGKGRNGHWLLGSGIVILVVLSLYAYYHYNEIYPATDNAYVNANLVNVAPKVNGYIKHLYVSDNQFVHRGELLLEIDPQDYTLQLTRAKQDWQLAQQQASSAGQQVAAAEASVARAKADYAFNQQLAARYANLYHQQAGSLQDMQKYHSQAEQAKQAVDKSTAELNQARANYQVASTQIALARTNVSNAVNNTDYTHLTAAVDGYVSHLNLQTGEFVSAGQKLFGLIDDNAWWVDVNFKETQLKRVKVGQRAVIKLDMYEHKYIGQVQSISYASGNTFSLLPAQNATGNWVKVTQRFTVRVKLNNEPQFPLRVGASCYVSVDTTK